MQKRFYGSSKTHGFSVRGLSGPRMEMWVWRIDEKRFFTNRSNPKEKKSKSNPYLILFRTSLIKTFVESRTTSGSNGIIELPL